MKSLFQAAFRFARQLWSAFDAESSRESSLLDFRTGVGLARAYPHAVVQLIRDDASERASETYDEKRSGRKLNIEATQARLL
jgi:hypothetical protein